MTQKRLILSLLCLFVLVACAPTAQQGGNPASAVTDYLDALVKNDTTKLSSLVCPAYEAGAKTEFDSFGAISGATLTNVKCTPGEISGSATSVTCTGSIDFTYNGEQNSQPLDGSTYSVKQVDGEWKMCGYQ
ncbi:MAG: hypothetical protein ABI700_27440 [Chloroflexota bacterium]